MRRGRTWVAAALTAVAVTVGAAGCAGPAGRMNVAIGQVDLRDARTLSVTVRACDGAPEVSDVVEGETEVRLADGDAVLDRVVNLLEQAGMETVAAVARLPEQFIQGAVAVMNNHSGTDVRHQGRRKSERLEEHQPVQLAWRSVTAERTSVIETVTPAYGEIPAGIGY